MITVIATKDDETAAKMTYFRRRALFPGMAEFRFKVPENKDIQSTCDVTTNRLVTL